MIMMIYTYKRSRTWAIFSVCPLGSAKKSKRYSIISMKCSLTCLPLQYAQQLVSYSLQFFDDSNWCDKNFAFDTTPSPFPPSQNKIK